jgi:hypothetical protein
LPPEDDPNNEESGSGNNESEEEPARARRETPRQQFRARGGYGRRPQDREPEDFNFMPQMLVRDSSKYQQPISSNRIQFQIQLRKH